MMGNIKLSEIKAKLATLLGRLPDGSSKKRLNREKELAKDLKHDEGALRNLLDELEQEAPKVNRAKKRPAVRKR